VEHSSGRLFLAEHSHKMTDSAFRKWRTKERRFLELSEEIVHENVIETIQNSSWSEFASAFKEIKVLQSQRYDQVDWY
jgi:hypothetical protein